MKSIRFPSLVLSVALACGAVGCSAPKPKQNPLAGWKMCWSQDPSKLDRAIKIDYEEYIKNLPAEKRSFVGGIFIFENDSNQHAVQIEVGVNGTYWYHVLIYDSDNIRVKAVKYRGGGYRS